MLSRDAPNGRIRLAILQLQVNFDLLPNSLQLSRHITERLRRQL